MNYNCKQFTANDSRELNDFLALPKKLYSKNELTQDIKCETSIIDGTHPLSGDFVVTPFILYDDGDAVARCAVTFYPNDDNAYVGFFECIDSTQACSALIDKVKEFAHNNGKNSLIGPLDASFWIRYRFKTTDFGTPYTGEPYNKEYYARLWLDCGFTVTDRFKSNRMPIPTETDRSEKGEKRLAMFIEKGYEFVSPTSDSFAGQMCEIYELLIELYSSFPAFKHITKEQFIELFSSLKLVIDFDMVKLVYKDGRMVAFSIVVPNYANLTNGKIAPLSLLKILKIKRKPDEYVALYMGVASDHAGLATALAELTKQKLFEKQARVITALIHEGKVTGNYYKYAVRSTSEYVLMKMDFKII